MGLKEHDEEIVGKGWKIVERNQNRISALVMDMLTFSKERKPELAVANLNEIVADVLELMRSGRRAARRTAMASRSVDAGDDLRSRGDPSRGAQRRHQRLGCPGRSGDGRPHRGDNAMQPR